MSFDISIWHVREDEMQMEERENHLHQTLKQNIIAIWLDPNISVKELQVKEGEKVEEGKGGSIDESERAFSLSERLIAEKLQSEGKHVKASAEGKGLGRSGDALVDGIQTEFKTPDPGADSATIKNQINNSTRRGGQARNMIIDARGSGLTEAEAMRGLTRAKNITRGRIDSIRVIGDGFDITSTDFQ